MDMKNQNTLRNVPAMWYGNPSAVCYIGAVMRLMEYIGDPVEQDELFALSGAGLCFPWRYASCCDEISVISQIPSRTFEALGYESEYLPTEILPDKETCLKKIKRSIDSGRPVIGFGITVKMPMSCLVVGYDGSGLYTRSFWPPEGAKYDAEEYFYSPDWYENCAGLLIVGKRTGKRLAGAAAYARIADWALEFHRCPPSVWAGGKNIYINQYAFDAMMEWLLDDVQWKDPNQGGKEQYLKQCGLLLLQYYRSNLYQYLKKLDKEYPNLVNPSVFTALEHIVKAMPGAHASDLWLYKAVDPELREFSFMSRPSLRKRVVEYVNQLKEYDNSVQWTLFMPELADQQAKDS